MATLTITAANVIAGAGAQIDRSGVAGVAVTAGQSLYTESATNTLKLADADSATAEARVCCGIALHAASAGQPLARLVSGPITIGATLALGGTYALSATAGGIAPIADLTTGAYPTILGVAVSTTVLNVNIQAAGVALP